MKVMRNAEGSSRKKVLLVLHTLSRTGSPKIAIEVFGSIGRRYDLRILAGDDGAFRDRCEQIAPTVVLNDQSPVRFGLAGKIAGRLSRAISLFRMRKWEPDLIYVNSTPALRVLATLDCECARRVPVILHVHELSSFIVEEIAYSKSLKTLPWLYIAVSTAVRDALIQSGVDGDRITIIHEFASRSAIRLSASARPTRLLDGPQFVVGGSGDISWRKGVTLWLQTAAAVRKKRPEMNVRFVWVGNASGRGADVRARQLGVEDIVEFTGEVNDAPTRYARFDAFLMSSWEDPCPLVVFEAMGLGIPVVCFAGGGGAPEQVGATGVVVGNFCPEAAADALLKLADDAKLRDQLGEAAKQRVSENFTDDQQIPKVAAEINALLASQVAKR